MKRIVLSIIFFLLTFASKAGENEKSFIHFFNFSDGTNENHLEKKTINGANELFTNTLVLNDIKEKLGYFNDTANINFNVFCGRVYIDYSKIDYWEYLPTDNLSSIKAAFGKLKEDEGYNGNTDNTLYLDALKDVYAKYLNMPNGKPCVLLVYLESNEYDLIHSTPQQPKWKKKKTFGFIDSGLSGDERLKMNYVKSLWGEIKPTIQLNAESKPDPQYLVQAFVNKYIEEHGKLIEQPNRDCPLCPIHPIKDSTFHWDDQGRLWVYKETNCDNTNWVDLSYEFSSRPCGNDVWKAGIDVQYVHEQYYAAKINFLEHYPLQHISGGVTPELKEFLWRSSQFSVVYALKDQYVDQEVGWQGWIPFWGSVKTGYYQASIANGDIIFQSKAGFNFVLAATDISLIKSLAQGIIKIGIKKWIIDGGIKIATKQAWYRVGKGWASFKLGYQLRNASIEGKTLFEKQLDNGIEIVETEGDRYIKFDRQNGDVLIGKFSNDVDKDILFEKNGKLSNVPANLSDEQLSEWLLQNTENVIEGGENLLDNIYNTQKGVVTQNIDVISTATNNAKGAWGEMSSDVFLTEKGFKPLHSRKTALTNGWGETGIDGVFVKDEQYYIVEAKYTGSSQLGQTVDGKQMSDTWILGSNRLLNAVGQEMRAEIINMGYTRLLAKTAPDGSIIYRQLDAMANDIGIFNP